MCWKEIRRPLVAYSVLILTYCLRAIPIRCTYCLGRLLGDLAYAVSRRERARAIRHLEEFYGERLSRREVRQIAKGVFQHFACSVMELLALRSPGRFLNRLSVSIEGLDSVRKVLEQGRGCLLLTGHIGNWELMAAYFARQGYSVHVVARPMRDPIYRKMVDGHRDACGLHVHYTKGEGGMSMVRALRRGDVLALLIDVRTEGEGRWVEFLGRPAYTLIGPAVLAAHTGAGVVFAYSVRTRPWAYRFVFHPALRVDPPAIRSGPEWENYVERILGSLNARLSAVIEQYPEQWMWMHRRHDPVRPDRRQNRLK